MADKKLCDTCGYPVGCSLKCPRCLTEVKRDCGSCKGCSSLGRLWTKKPICSENR